MTDLLILLVGSAGFCLILNRMDAHKQRERRPTAADLDRTSRELLREFWTGMRRNGVGPCHCDRGIAEYNLASHAAHCPMWWDPSHGDQKLWRVLRLVWDLENVGR